MVEGYSGADIKQICRDAAMAPMRRAVIGKSPDDIRRMKERGELEVSLRLSDFEDAIRRIQPSVEARVWAKPRAGGRSAGGWGRSWYVSPLIYASHQAPSSSHGLETIVAGE